MRRITPIVTTVRLHISDRNCDNNSFDNFIPIHLRLPSPYKYDFPMLDKYSAFKY
jgi:hypothetical protein